MEDDELDELLNDMVTALRECTNCDSPYTRHAAALSLLIALTLIHRDLKKILKKLKEAKHD